MTEPDFLYLFSADTWLSFVNALCEFAYVCGIEAAQLGLPRKWQAEVTEPQCILAFEAGWDEGQQKKVN